MITDVVTGDMKDVRVTYFFFRQGKAPCFLLCVMCILKIDLFENVLVKTIN